MLFKKIPGHEQVKQHLLAEVKQNRVSHAQMFIGPSGIGKLNLALAFANYLLCESPKKNDACGVCKSCQQIAGHNHPDLNYVFPIVKSAKSKISISDDVRKEFITLLDRDLFFDLHGWLNHLGELGKNPVIAVDESRSINKKLALKAFSNKYKIMVIWLPELMNLQAANKLLKLLEEPPEKTLFFLVSDQQDHILPTILSRTQFVKVNALPEEEIEQYLKKNHGIDDTVAHSIAGLAQGNLVEAIQFAQGNQESHVLFELFVRLMRIAYAANALDLMSISEELAQLDRETQRNFLKYGMHVFRESIVLNYLKGDLVNLRNEERSFLDKFARFINNKNIYELMDEFNSAYYQIGRNANAKILFTDLTIKLTKLIKKGV